MSLGADTAKTYAKYLVPLTACSVIAFAPLVALTLRITPPTDPAGVRTILKLGYVAAAASWLPVMILVGAAAVAARGGSQLRVLGRAIVQMLRAIVPCLVASIAIVLGGLALVIPGALLIVLYATTSASTLEGVPARLADSVAVARARITSVVGVIVASVVIGIVVVYLVQHVVAPIPIPAKPTPEHYLAFQRFVRVSIGCLALLAPIPAVALATIHRSHHA